MSTTYVATDLHLGHRLVAGLRGYDDTDAHDAAITAAWAATITPTDIVWVLGDIAVRRPAHALTLLGDLPGRKRLIPGNHDRVHPMHRDAPRHWSAYAAVFEYIATTARLRGPDGTEVLLHHFPYAGDHTTDDRHGLWRLPDTGIPLIHGHTHATERLTYTPAGTPQLHAGIDAWGPAPIPLHTLLAHLPTP